MSLSPTPLTREQRMFLAIWRKAYRDREKPEPVAFRASSKSSALTIRSGMYRAIRPYRQGILIDEELRQASEMFVVSVPVGKDPKSIHTLTMKPRTSLSDLEAEFLNLGLEEADLMLPEEAALNQGLAKLVDKSNLGAQRPTNPFYTRDD